MGRHAHATCIVCGSRLHRAWLARANALPRRWGYVLESSGRRAIRKIGDFPISRISPADVTRWLGAYAETLAALATGAVADLLAGGWRLETLQRLAVALRLHGFMERVVEYVYVTSPTIEFGTASVAGFQHEGDIGVTLPQARVAAFTMEDE
jgi:hypothetical protein